MNEIVIGREGKDKVTGFKGIIAGRAVYLYGCEQILLTPKCNKDGTYKESRWFDGPRIECIGKGISPKEVRSEKPGGDIQAPTK
jgi:hypothetical protein